MFDSYYNKQTTAEALKINQCRKRKTTREGNRNRNHYNSLSLPYENYRKKEPLSLSLSIYLRLCSR